MLSCALYDAIELVCLYRYRVVVELKNGRRIEGQAIDTARNNQGEECIKLLAVMPNHDSFELICLSAISQLQVQGANPHLQQIDFP